MGQTAAKHVSCSPVGLEKTGVDRTIRDLLIAYKDANCMDARDKVFALASLSSKTQVHLDFDYAIKSVELFFSVLDFAHEHEKLKTDDAVELMLQLKRQLNISRAELEQGYKDLVSENRFERPNTQETAPALSPTAEYALPQELSPLQAIVFVLAEI